MRTRTRRAGPVWRQVRDALKRRGAILPLSAVTLAAVSALVALGIDMSVVSLERQKMQNACDAAALAASQEIISAVSEAADESSGDGEVSASDANSIAQGAAKLMAAKVAGMNGVYVDPERDVVFGRRYHDEETGEFLVDWETSPFNVVKVTARKDNPEPGQPDSALDLFFAGVTGQGSASVTVSSVAYVEARDIVMVLDYSSSMNDDSTFGAFSKLGQTNVEANMLEIWNALGPPSAGSLPFTPAWLDVSKTNAENGGTVIFKNTSVDVSMTNDYKKVVLTFTDGQIQNHTPNSGTKSGTYSGTGGNNGKTITKVDVETETVVMSTGPSDDEPAGVKLTGKAPTSNAQPQLYVTYHGSKIYVESSKNLSNVVLEFSDGVRQKFDSLTLKKQWFEGTASNSGKWIVHCWVHSGNNASGDGPGYGEKFVNPNGAEWPTVETTTTSISSLSFEDNTAAVKAKFGLTGAYPYASGSWDDFISYNRTSNTVRNAGYRRKYGGLVFVQYLLSNKFQQNQTADLWKTPHYPFHAMKEGATLFTQFLADLDFGDELGLVNYAVSANVETGQTDLGDGETADLGTDLITPNHSAIDIIQRHKQAGNYTSNTNIAAGIQSGTALLLEHKRYGARPTLFVMTDGNANVEIDGWELPDDWDWDALFDYDGDGSADYSTENDAKLCALVMAKQAVDAGITIHTMTIGADADTDLMEAIAFLGKGQWVNCPGGTTIAEMEGQLLVAFGKIAANVPPAKLLIQDEE